MLRAARGAFEAVKPAAGAVARHGSKVAASAAGGAIEDFVAETDDGIEESEFDWCELCGMLKGMKKKKKKKPQS
ncbi:Hypothetical predicted protein [Octopus vulgaris]|uniref:Uncharacterized protein n=1 Tax=Octopus vulgaris TaxID=6645 RepID=A0AA36FJJ9_OCTVU|nr:Hypothetical predicted protein [Octopus vulgaris]